tara:strand:+ start:19185 stop:20708 length:1524 start_codon:yes stop_codon:yes gene_type:complete
VRSIYDPTAGTGGFLSSGMEYVHELNDKAALSAFGQELNPESYAICKADMLIKGQKVDNIKLGNTLSDDQLPADKFDYMLSNPPFGVDWKKVQKKINDEHKDKGFEGRFGAGLPRVSDGSLLFLMHLISKMRRTGSTSVVGDRTSGTTDQQGSNSTGSRIGIILNGSPLFTGGAGSGESEIRRYILENDLLEAIIALPTDMFYNTGIATYVWVLSNHKTVQRKGKVQLINASKERAKTGGRGRGSSSQNQGGESTEEVENVFYQAMRKSLGSKRKELTEESIETIVKTYGQFAENEFSKIFDYQDFGYRRITVERPLKLAFEVTEDNFESYCDDYLLKAQKKSPDITIDIQPPAGYTVLQSLIGKEKVYSRSKFFNHFTEKLSTTEKKSICKFFAEQDENAETCLFESGKQKGQPEPNPDLRDNENVPLKQSVQDYFEREVLPHVPDAWIDETKVDAIDGEVGIVGYEIPFNRHFYVYQPPRALEAIDADLDAVSADIMTLLQEVHS